MHGFACSSLLTACSSPWGAGADQGRCARVRTKMHVAACEALTRLGVKYSYPSGARPAPDGGETGDLKKEL